MSTPKDHERLDGSHRKFTEEEGYNKKCDALVRYLANADDALDKRYLDFAVDSAKEYTDEQMDKIWIASPAAASYAKIIEEFIWLIKTKKETPGVMKQEVLLRYHLKEKIKPREERYSSKKAENEL